jgi:putative serine protease PepD
MLTGQGGSIGLGFAIPINEARRVAQQLIRTGRATHAVIGALLNLRYHGPGAQVSSRTERGASGGDPAALAGLRPGDIIVRFGGQPVPNTQTLLDAIRSRAPGTWVRVTYLRQGHTHVTRLQLAAAPA